MKTFDFLGSSRNKDQLREYSLGSCDKGGRRTYKIAPVKIGDLEFEV